MPSILSEPIRLAELVRAVALLLGTLGILVTEDVQQAVVVVAGAIAVIGSWLISEWQRRKVYAPDTVQKIANAATFQDPGTTVDIGTPPDGGW